VQADKGFGDLGSIHMYNLSLVFGIRVDMIQDIIEIKRQAKRNVIVSALIGLVGLFLASIAFTMLPKTLYLIGIFLTSASLVALLIAWVKYREPQFSFLLSKTSILYKHRHGQWQLDWSNIQRVDVPKVTQGLEHKSLDMVAIKIKDYSAFLKGISPRLMTNVLMEQRPLLLYEMAATEGCASGGCNSDDMLENDYFKDSDGTEYQGIQAMFANRMSKLRTRLGYDLFVAGSELDRPEQKFVDLMRQCQQRVLTTSHSDDEAK
jgi:xanthosine utilization system XapX-like protein